MIKRIHIKQYRKLKDMDITFNKGINIISGTNGTCKSSLLHIVSNSFQTINKGQHCDFVTDKSCIETIKVINNTLNPKIENLTKGDKEYNDPAVDVKGTLFTVDYVNSPSLNFRKHNSTKSGLEKRSRYAIKPQYNSKHSESLPFCPIIYLGLSRLVPIGEFQQDEDLTKLKKSLPEKYLDETQKIYGDLTHLKIDSISTQNMGNIKVRSEFITDIDGIDSNTISAGEDNLYIIISSLVSLKYYYDSIKSNNDIESILLIDEADATLHPSLQFKLLKLFEEFSDKYKIQIIFTTHSISMLEYASAKKYNIIYLLDNISKVSLLNKPDIYKIKRILKNESVYDIYDEHIIPVFTEDNESRIFLKILFEHLEKIHPEFKEVSRYFHFLNASIGADSLTKMFQDRYLNRSIIQAICILDGDQKYNLEDHIIKLPGDSSPENMIMEYSKKIYDTDDCFWSSETLIDLGFTKIYYRDNIMPDIDNIPTQIEKLKNNGETTHGVQRELSKKVFHDHNKFFEFMFKSWLHNPENLENIEQFYSHLHSMYKKVSPMCGIDPNLWELVAK